MDPLPEPLVERCYVDDGFRPGLAVMQLRWEETADGPWHLPLGLSMAGPLPRRFAIRVHRYRPDAYELQLLWNRIRFMWIDLSRAEILASSLSDIMAALKTDLGYLLDQPNEGDDPTLPRAA